MMEVTAAQRVRRETSTNAILTINYRYKVFINEYMSNYFLRFFDKRDSVKFRYYGEKIDPVTGLKFYDNQFVK